MQINVNGRVFVFVIGFGLLAVGVTGWVHVKGARADMNELHPTLAPGPAILVQAGAPPEPVKAAPKPPTKRVIPGAKSRTSEDPLAGLPESVRKEAQAATGNLAGYREQTKNLAEGYLAEGPEDK